MIRRIRQRLRNRVSSSLSSQDAYAKWSQTYPPTPHNLLMEIEQESMLSLISSLHNKRVLDLASGTGRYGLIAKEQGASIVLGVDNSIEMIEKSVLDRCLVGSMTQIPLADASIDVVLCGLAVGHYSDLDAVFREISRVLIRGGQAIISDFHPFQYLRGARRTFSLDNKVYEVEHYPHLYQTIQRASLEAGLAIDAVDEPTIGGDIMPVVLVYRLLKL